jgi:DNA-binding response OmpR family regulator
MSAGCTILVVEDDAAIRRGLLDALRFAGYEVIDACDGRRGLALALESAVDLVLLDVMLPGMDGFAVLQELRRAQPSTPVIMVTARGAEDDRVRGLDHGADDYVVKPFSPRELLARVEAVLRRSPGRSGDVRSIRADGMLIDLERRQATAPDGSVVGLTEREAALLRYLAVSGGRAIDRDELLHRVWGLNPKGLRTRTVDMHVARLREKLERESTWPRILLTVRGRGYRLAEGAQVEGP